MSSTESVPLISVILPVHDGTATLDRALRSLDAQTFSDWELIAVDDASKDDSHAILQGRAARDAGIRVVQLDENRGPGAARNAGLQVARGQWIAYLDHDDEYCPDYLQRLAAHCEDKADVLVFAYDIVHPDGQSNVWEPGTSRHELFSTHLAMPMALAHRRQVIEKTGGFNELLWWEEDAEFLRRLARSGVEIRFLPEKCGLYHVRADSRRRAPRLTLKQKEILEANWRERKPLYGERPSGGSMIGQGMPESSPAVDRQIRKIAFVSPCSVIDYTSGAAVATASALRFLRQVSFDCEAFCGSYHDAPEEGLLEEMLTRQNIPYEVRGVRLGDYEARMMFSFQGTVPVTIFRTASTRGRWTDEAEFSAFLRAYTDFLEKHRPDAIWTYGGDAASDAMIQLAKDRGIIVVFGLHNFSYQALGTFASVDYVTVPSDFSRQYHWKNLGLACHTLPYAIDWQRVQVAGREPRFVTFVNPQTTKGLYLFARIAEVLAARRPDILLMVIAGRSQTTWRHETGIDLGRLQNVSAMSSMGDPRSFYVLTKILLMPSLWNESFGLAPAEAMLNGIPVLASNRGALPETMGGAGFVFDIPACYTPETRTLPTAEEAEPWVQTIIRLWDDAEFYQRASEAAKQRAEHWRPERLAATYRDFFGNLFPQPGPPLVPMPARPAPMFVTCTLMGKGGRLGNQLFQIAATIGAARRNGMEFVFSPWANAEYFQRPIPQATQIVGAQLYIEPTFAYREIRVCRPTDIAGVFQSERYFKHCEEEVRSYFTPRPELTEYLRTRFGEVLKTKTCSVHVRRGDYVGNGCFADLAATDYYERAMARFSRDTTFLFFSDDMPWCRTRFTDPRIVFVEGQREIADLFLMSFCQDHIIANSSFSWWGAWLDPRKEKTVIAPSCWFAGPLADPKLPFTALPYEGYMDTSDLIPAEWVRM